MLRTIGTEGDANLALYARLDPVKLLQGKQRTQGAYHMLTAQVQMGIVQLPTQTVNCLEWK